MKNLQLTLKRTFDIVICSIILVLFSPVFLIIAILVRLSSPGPIFFVQERAGLHQKPFSIYKFRTMVQRRDNQQTLSWTQDDVNRTTKIGAFLRDYGLDELPQVLNIIRGDMSVVGPRPPLAEQAERYTEYQKQVFVMRPGVLSLAAIRGRRTISPEQRIDTYVEYVNNWSLWLDLVILWKSLFVVLKRQDAAEKYFASKSAAQKE